MQVIHFCVCLETLNVYTILYPSLLYMQAQSTWHGNTVLMYYAHSKSPTSAHFIQKHTNLCTSQWWIINLPRSNLPIKHTQVGISARHATPRLTGFTRAIIVDIMTAIIRSPMDQCTCISNADARVNRLNLLLPLVFSRIARLLRLASVSIWQLWIFALTNLI